MCSREPRIRDLNTLSGFRTSLNSFLPPYLGNSLVLVLSTIIENIPMSRFHFVELGLTDSDILCVQIAGNLETKAVHFLLELLYRSLS